MSPAHQRPHDVILLPFSNAGLRARLTAASFFEVNPMRSTLLRVLLLVAAVAVGATPAAAQRGWNPLDDDPKQPSQPTKAPGASRMIVRAVTAAGQPVTDLKAEEVTIKTDGRDRKITDLTLVTAPKGGPGGAPAAATAAPPASTLPAPFATNAAAPAAAPGTREFLFILDEEGIGPGREEPVRKLVAQLTTNAAPGDRFGLISLRQGGMEVQPSPPPAVTAALTKFVGGGSQNESAADMVCRSQRAMQTLSAALRSSPAGRTIVLISPGLIASPKGVQEMSSVAGAAAGTGSPELCQIRSNDFDQLGGAAATSPANVYVLHYLDGMASTNNVRAAQEGIENIAGTINGEVVRVGGGTEASVNRVLTETSAYYIATIEPAGDGAVRRVEARSTREGIKITARPAGRGAGGAAGATPPKAGSPEDMIRVADVYRDVPVRARGMVSRVPGSQDLMIMTLFEPEDPATRLKAAVVALFDQKGQLKAKWSAKSSELSSYPIAAALPVAAGTYRMRVAVTDESGKGGTTDSDVEVQLTDAGPLKLGGLVMGTDQKSPKLLFKGTDQQVIGFLPIYGVTKDMKISAVYEVRESATGAPLGTTDGNVIEMPGDARMLWGGFGLTPLAAGDYQMRVVVTVDGKEAGVVTRTLRKLQ